MTHTTGYMHVVEGSEQWYCRIDGCSQFAWSNQRYGYCDAHLMRFLNGERDPDKGFPPVGWPISPYSEPQIIEGGRSPLQDLYETPEFQQAWNPHAFEAGESVCAVCGEFEGDEVHTKREAAPLPSPHSFTERKQA